MRYMICLLIAASVLLLPVTGLARVQSNPSQANKESCNRVVIKLKSGQKIEGCFGWYQCDSGGKNCGMQIIQNGVARRILQSDIDKWDFRKSFWRKVGDIALIPVALPIYIMIIIACRKNCEL